MIGECIETADPIRHQWLLAPDVIAVTQGALLVPPPVAPPVPVVEPYETDGLNGGQFTLLRYEESSHDESSPNPILHPLILSPILHPLILSYILSTSAQYTILPTLSHHPPSHPTHPLTSPTLLCFSPTTLSPTLSHHPPSYTLLSPHLPSHITHPHSHTTHLSHPSQRLAGEYLPRKRDVGTRYDGIT